MGVGRVLFFEIEVCKTLDRCEKLMRDEVISGLQVLLVVHSALTVLFSFYLVHTSLPQWLNYT